MASKDSGAEGSVALFSAAPSGPVHRPLSVLDMESILGSLVLTYPGDRKGVPPPWPRRHVSAEMSGSGPLPSMRLDLASQCGTAARDAARRAVRVGELDAAFGEGLMLAELLAHDELPVEGRDRIVARFGVEKGVGSSWGGRVSEVLPSNVRLRLI